MWEREREREHYVYATEWKVLVDFGGLKIFNFMFIRIKWSMIGTQSVDTKTLKSFVMVVRRVCCFILCFYFLSRFPFLIVRPQELVVCVPRLSLSESHHNTALNGTQQDGVQFWRYVKTFTILNCYFLQCKLLSPSHSMINTFRMSIPLSFKG